MTAQINEERAVAQIVHQQVQGMLTKDLDLLDRVIASDAKFGHITGQVQSKAEWLQQIRLGRMRYFGSREVLFQVTIHGDQAQVVMRNELDARIYGFRNTWPLQSTVKLLKGAHGWQIVESRASMY
ncbi:nuclear transport factor 2 family protein [Lactiplantibacillus garii]|uniref:Nuclear transport factor 2 family protein n=1 Tax=Lactiplantibacillus garii TaxID=2306423 RepID=A0A426D6E8_9LACO|nr:nuclear transport factor 2 family protein [Lactiplantibacillus garii]RRK10203.1 nuclear transport factor 2 family protein [Lactiplantibacillus garii]